MTQDSQEIPFEISCPEVKSLCDAGTPFLLDVRTPAEHAIVHLPDAMLIPMQEIVQRVGELAERRDEQIVVFCHHGGRSEQVALWLRQQGFSNAQNMVGGIDAWAVQVDPSLSRY